MKNNSGFSLVELIVVIAIMAILAGVAGPTYTKYIAKANDAKVISQLDEVKTAAISAGVDKGVVVEEITITITSKVGSAIATDETSVTATEINKFLTTADSWKINFTGTSYEGNATLKWTASTGKWQ